MSTSLTVQQMSTTDIVTMAETFAKSGLFKDTADMAKAFVKIQAGQEIGIAPFQAMSGIHIIQGKPTIGAGIMASKLKGSGKYDYKVLQQDEKACILEFFKGKESLGQSKFTIEDATKAGTQNIAKYARNMLFARAISNGVKWYCPDIFNGPVYTPEDFNVNENEATTTVDAEHEEIKTLPPINTKQFGQLVDKIKGGDTEAEDKAVAMFSFSQEQIDTLASLNNIQEAEEVTES